MSDRRRICTALQELVGEVGYTALDAEAVCRRAEVEPVVFDRHFPSLDACFAAVWTSIDVQLSVQMRSGFTVPGGWRERMRNALGVGLRFLAEDEGRARLYLAEFHFAGDGVRIPRASALERLAGLIDRGREEPTAPERLPGTLAEAIAGGIWHRVADLVRAGRAAELPDELPNLMYFVVMPFLGREAAQEERTRLP